MWNLQFLFEYVIFGIWINWCYCMCKISSVQKMVLTCWIGLLNGLNVLHNMCWLGSYSVSYVLLCHKGLQSASMLFDLANCIFWELYNLFSNVIMLRLIIPKFSKGMHMFNNYYQRPIIPSINNWTLVIY